MTGLVIDASILAGFVLADEPPPERKASPSSERNLRTAG